jgi:hypothetical protein
MAGTTALTDDLGSVVERYIYDSYGSVTILDASGGPVSGNRSKFGNTFTRIGRWLDYESGFYVCEGFVHARLGQMCNGGPSTLPYQPADDPFEAFRKRMEEEERRRKKQQEEEDLVEYHDCISGRVYLIPRRLLPGFTPPRRGDSNRLPPGSVIRPPRRRAPLVATITPPTNSDGCSGLCVKGKNVQVLSCSVSKLVIEKGSDPICERVLNEASICGQLRSQIASANSKHPEGWSVSYCSSGCNCDHAKGITKSGTQVIGADDYKITRTESLVVTSVTCVVTVSFRVEVDGDSVGLTPCKKI